MSKSVVVLSKQAFLPSEPIDIHISKIENIKYVGIFIALLKTDESPLEWTLMKVIAPGKDFTFSKDLSPGFYAIGIDINKKIEIHTIFKVTNSLSGTLQDSALLSACGVLSCLCIIKSTFYKGFRR